MFWVSGTDTGNFGTWYRSIGIDVTYIVAKVSVAILFIHTLIALIASCILGLCILVITDNIGNMQNRSEHTELSKVGNTGPKYII